MTDVRAITLWQPYASLVALLVKRIETRGWATRYRGRLLIHAAKKMPPEGMEVGDATVERWRDDPSAPCMVWRGNHRRGYDLPLGAVVASCVLADCVPMVDTADAAFGQGAGEGSCIVVDDGRLDLCMEGEEATSVEDQRPYGDFAPGRYGWLLEDIRPVEERCPACWGGTEDVARHRPGHLAEVIGPMGCWVCGGSGRCAPIPMKGRQGLWTPRWTA